MRVFVAGATGVLGRRLIRQLVACGHTAVGLTRTDKGDQTVRAVGGEPTRADLFDGERIARDAGAAHGFRAAILRCGGFYSSDGWHTRIFGESLARGRPILVDGGAAVWSWVHAEDAAGAFLAACEWPKSGVWHIVDDRPVSLSDYRGALARRLGARPPRHLPRSLAHLVLGRYTAELLTSSFATSNARFGSDFRWQPAYPP